jgi:hypothetical protein
LNEYNFNIKHIKGNENKVVVALGKRVCVMHVSSIIMCKSYLKNIILEALISDGYYLEVKEEIQHELVQHK